MTETMTDAIMAAALARLSGQVRSGQQTMARAVAATLPDGGRLLVQAGTGTGKSLAYLAPAAAHLIANRSSRVVVATATLALQTQLATKDVPLVLSAVADVSSTKLRWSLLKGRANYVCLLKLRDGVAAEPALFGEDEVAAGLRATGADAQSVLGAEVVALRSWADGQLNDQETGDRDDAPRHSAEAWYQLSVSNRECLGARRCPRFTDCFVERARDQARHSDLNITNHALLAVDAEADQAVIPDHDVVIIDEAHDLPARVTSAATVELSPQAVERIIQRVTPWLSDPTVDSLVAASEAFQVALEATSPGRLTDPASPLIQACRQIETATRAGLSGLKGQASSQDNDRQQAAQTLDGIHEIAQRTAALDDSDVVWLSQRPAFGPQLVAAPLSVARIIRDTILTPRSAILTSATLALGGTFTGCAVSLGLSPANDVSPPGESGGAETEKRS
ncbi:MAG: ATP-dependent DNA helicase, partial [Propionibacteriaceae bacterium]|nr:ATP-dependent DNA helicase [Propionibacteriaceae bacterium]